MTVCPSCGFRNEESESFCRNPACASFLGWGDERVHAERRSGVRVDAAGGREGLPSNHPSVEEDTQPFDTASEARRTDSPAEQAAPPAGPAVAPGPAAGPAGPAAGPPAGPSGPPSGLATPPARPPVGPFTPAAEPAPPSAGPPAPPAQPAPPSAGPPAPPASAAPVTPPAGPPAGPAASAAPPPAPPPPPADPAAGAEAESGADPFATGPFAPGQTWRSIWQDETVQASEPPGSAHEPADDWSWTVPPERADEPAPTTGGGQDPERRVLSAAESAWGTQDFVHPPDKGEPRRQPSDFPSEDQLLKRPPLWERALRNTPIGVPGEGGLRHARSARERERKRALLRFGALILVIVLVGGGLWLASSRKPASVAGGGNGPGTTGAPKLTSVRPGRVTASTQSGSRVAANVIDGKTGTFWSRLAPSNDQQPFLRFFFNRPVKLARISIAGGAAGAEFSQRPRPRQIELRFSDDTTVRATLSDRAAFQSVSFTPRQVNVVRLVILSTYPSAGPQRTSVSEVRFFAAKD